MGDLFKGGNPAKDAMKGYDAKTKKIIAELKEQMPHLTVPELEKLAYEGDVEAEQIEGSKLSDIKTDPRLERMQYDTLSDLEKLSKEGITAEEKLQEEELLQKIQAEGRAQRKARDQKMAMRGTLDSGASYAADEGARQGSMTSAKMEALQKAASRRNRMDQASLQKGSMAAQMQASDFGRKSQIGQAEDIIARNNAQNRQATNMANRNMRQQIRGVNQNVANQQAMLPNQISQQNWQNQMGLGNMQMGAAGNLAQMQASQPAQLSPFEQAMQIGMAGSQIYSNFTPMRAANQVARREDGGIIRANAGLGGDQTVEAARMQQSGMAPERMQRLKDSVETMATDKIREGVKRGMALERQKEQKLREVAAMDKLKKQKAVKEKDRLSELAKGFQMASEIGKPKSSGVDLNLADVQGQVQSNLPQYNPIQPIQAEDGVSGAEALDYGADMLSSGLESAITDAGSKAVDPETARIDALMQTLGERIAMENEMTTAEKAPYRPGTDFASPDDRNAAALAAMMQQLQGMENPIQPPMAPGMEDGGTYQAEDGEFMFTSDGLGDIVGGDSFERDRVDARLNSGEAVLNVAQQQRLMDLLRGKISMDEVPDEDIVEGVPSDYQDMLTDEIDFEDSDDSEDEVKARGFNELLKMLGSK